ncbi:biosynthetic-type acetolactate synthase large subunit [Anaeroselena agilis]|uniref:Acetolactate synthase n=1 Tax=Anaeroselena agilis TaxID=3063788 RepID=A0ABU3P353_9FIRM|nr:biosynthetic-type acetolactate synthase large subunit [Selenomonadales bacterium 4137-cl]
MQLTGAEAVVKCLVEEGVDTVFGYPGGQIMPLYDALYDAPLRHILTVHEQGAVHAADGYARAGGRVGVCIATSGPGATNLVTGLAAAYLDSVPLVAITGQVPTGMLGRDSFQEVDITGITMSVTKHNFLVRDAARIPEIMRLAFRIARSGRPGPVLVDLPRDVQQGLLTFYPAEPAPAKRKADEARTEEAVGRAAAAIKAARRPVLVLGGGVIRGQASHEAALLAEKLGLPVVGTLMGLGALPSNHPQWLGLTGMHGHVAANRAVHEADLVIAAGSRFSDRVTGDPKRYPAGKTFIHLDIDRSEIGKNVASHIALIGELGPLLASLAARAAAGDIAAWTAAVAAWRAEYRADYSAERLNAPWIMNEISRQAAGQPVVFATDVGQHQMWAAQHLSVDAPSTWLTSGGLGCMGFGLPAALGAQVAAPGHRVVLVAGDGGFKMTGMELHTLAAYNLPVIAVVLDNRCLGMVRQWQQLFYRERYSASIAPRELDFAAFAEVCGVPGRKVATPAEFTAAFAAAWQAGGPAVIAADIATKDIVTPMIAPGAALNEFVNVK